MSGERGPGRHAAAWGLLLFLSLPAVGSAPALRGYGDGPPPAHTGGFGEPTCAACHHGPRPGRDVRLTVEGLPARYAAAKTYRLTVVLRAPDLSRGGFQLSTRFLEGGCRGDQGGVLRAVGARVAIDAAGTGPGTGAGGVTSYARHTLAGATPEEPERRGRLAWRVDWTAPSAEARCARRAVALDVAANASNHDASEFGDRIVARRLVVPGPGPETPAGGAP